MDTKETLEEVHLTSDLGQPSLASEGELPVFWAGGQ